MSTEQEYSVIREVEEHHRENIIEADLLLKEICQASRRPTFAETTFFSRELGWDEAEVNKQLRRMNNVLRNQAIAGTAADREASLKESETAAAVLKKEGQKLSAKIAELQAKADGLKRDARLSQKRVEEQNDAAAKLSELVPEHIAGAVRSAVQSIESSIGRELRDGEVRINELECCLTPGKYPNESAWLETLERSFRPAVLRVEERGVYKRKLSPEWPGIKASIQSELAELQTRLSELRQQYDTEIQQAEEPLNYYAR